MIKLGGKVGYFFPIVVSILPPAEFGRDDHRANESHSRKTADG